MNLIGFAFADGSKGYVIVPGNTGSTPEYLARLQDTPVTPKSLKTDSQQTQRAGTRHFEDSRMARLLRVLPKRRMTEDDLQSSAPMSQHVLRAALPMRFAQIDAETELFFPDADSFVFAGPRPA
jgi:hypothetical protein